MSDSGLLGLGWDAVQKIGIKHSLVNEVPSSLLSSRIQTATLKHTGQDMEDPSVKD